MGVVGIAWIFILQKGEYKYKIFIVIIYLLPLIIEVCFWARMILEGLYWAHRTS